MINQDKSYGLRQCACCTTIWLYPPEQPCVACHGIGQVMVANPVRECPRCNGTGRARHAHPVFGVTCDACWGSGWRAAVWVPKTVTEKTTHQTPLWKVHWGVGYSQWGKRCFLVNVPRTIENYHARQSTE